MLECTWRFYETQKRLPENTVPYRVAAPFMLRYEAKSASASLFHPMPALLCLPGERTPCEREEMRCKGQRVPIRATPLSPICAQFMPLCCCGLRGSPTAAPTRARRQFFNVPPSLCSLSALPFSSVKQKSDTAL